MLIACPAVHSASRRARLSNDSLRLWCSVRLPQLCAYNSSTSFQWVNGVVASADCCFAVSSLVVCILLSLHCGPIRVLFFLLSLPPTYNLLSLGSLINLASRAVMATFSLCAARGARLWSGIRRGCSVRPLPGSNVRGLFPVPIRRPSTAVLHAQPGATVPPNTCYHREGYGIRRPVGESFFRSLRRPMLLSHSLAGSTPSLLRISSVGALDRFIPAMRGCYTISLAHLNLRPGTRRWRPHWMTWRAPFFSIATTTTRT